MPVRDESRPQLFTVLRKNRAPVRFAYWLVRALPKVNYINTWLARMEERGNRSPLRGARLKDAEASFLQTGTGLPDRAGILDVIAPAAGERLGTSLRPEAVDQGLVHAGYSPEYYRFIAGAESGLFVSRPDGTVERCDPGPAWQPDFQFLCRIPGYDLVLTESGDRAYLIAPAEGAYCPSEGELVLLETAPGHENPRAFLAEHKKRKYYPLRSATPAPDIDGFKVRPAVISAQIVCRGGSKWRFRRDKLTISVAPFQDALLPRVGDDLGFFKEEGLDVRFEDKKNWYEFESRDDPHWLAFGNVYTFARHLAKQPVTRSAFLFGGNIFSEGNAILCSPERWRATFDGKLGGVPSGKLKWQRVMGLLKKEGLRLHLPPDSDFAVQLFKSCVAAEVTFTIDGVIVNKGSRSLGTVDLTPMLPKQFVTFEQPVGNFHFGTLPQRILYTEAMPEKERWKELMGPSDFLAQRQINGFIGSLDLLQEPQNILSRFLHGWFRIARLVNSEQNEPLVKTPRRKVENEADDGGAQRFLKASWIVDRYFRESQGAARLRYESGSGDQVVRQIAQAWTKESFPASPKEVRGMVLTADKGVDAPWLADLKQTADYLSVYPPVEDLKLDVLRTKKVYEKHFPLDQVLSNYEKLYGPSE